MKEKREGPALDFGDFVDRTLLRDPTPEELADPGPKYFDNRALTARRLAGEAPAGSASRAEWLRVAVTFERTAASIRRGLGVKR